MTINDHEDQVGSSNIDVDQVGPHQFVVYDISSDGRVLASLLGHASSHLALIPLEAAAGRELVEGSCGLALISLGGGCDASYLGVPDSRHCVASLLFSIVQN